MTATDISESPWAAEENAAIERDNAVVELLRWVADQPERPHADNPEVNEWLTEAIHKVRRQVLDIQMERDMAMVRNGQGTGHLFR